MAVFTITTSSTRLSKRSKKALQPGAGRDHQKGRDAIASMAHKVARSKTYIDNAGKDTVAELKTLPKQIGRKPPRCS